MSFDIREHKKRQRTHFREIREQITPRQKLRWDTAIIRHITAHPLYREAGILLAYMPMRGEIDLVPLLEHAWGLGKQAALPYCLPGQPGVMSFHIVSSVDGLIPNRMGCLEPNPKIHQKLEGFDKDCLCLVPGYSFDDEGYRLGYGGGYYDRFLNGVYGGGHTFGTCYRVCMVRHLTRGSFDKACGHVADETGVRRVRAGR